MPEAEASGKRTDSRSRGGSDPAVGYNLDAPHVVEVAKRRIAIARDLVLLFRDGRFNVVRVQVAARGFVQETDQVAVLDHFRLAWVVFMEILGSVLGEELLPRVVDDPFIVGVLVVVAGNLLLLGTGGKLLHVRVQETAAISVIFERDDRAIRQLWE